MQTVDIIYVRAGPARNKVTRAYRAIATVTSIYPRYSQQPSMKSNVQLSVLSGLGRPQAPPKGGPGVSGQKGGGPGGAGVGGPGVSETLYRTLASTVN